jgi:hypothetical protein
MLMTNWTILLLILLMACGQRKPDNSMNDEQSETDKKELTPADKQLIQDFTTRRLTFKNYLEQHELQNEKSTCPSCGFPTLSEKASYEICPVCDWEDDGQDDSNADEVLGGPNSDLSLTDSRLKIGKELKLLADSLKGEIVIEPEYFFKILSEHEKRMRIIEGKIKDDTDINDPLWDSWRQTRELMKADLIKR